MLLAHYSYYPTGSVKTVNMGNSLTLSYTYHISGAVKTAMVMSADNRELYADTLYYEDCGNNACTPQYNGNISRMAHHLAHGNSNYGEFRDVRYTYDELNRLINVNDSKQDVFDEIFAYDAQGRIVAQRRDTSIAKNIGGEYAYYANTNRLKSVADGMGGTADERNMSDTANFVYDSEGNLVEDRSKGLKISYDWRGMPVEFRLEPTGSSSDTARLSMMYDGSGRRISKTFLTKSATATSWDTVKVTHYTGIGTEIREEFHNGSRERVSVVVNMPQGLGRYKVADASQPADDNASRTFEWYLKNHLGSTMLVYGTVSSTDQNTADIGETKAAYDYRAFGEMVTLSQPSDKVTENFTGKELDDEIALNYFGVRYLDPMLGLWISVDAARQFDSPYLYMGNGTNPIILTDTDGNVVIPLWVVVVVGGGIGGITAYASEKMFGAVTKMGNWAKNKIDQISADIKISRKVANHNTMDGNLTKEEAQQYDQFKEHLRDGLSEGLGSLGVKGAVKGVIPAAKSGLMKIGKKALTSEEDGVSDQPAPIPENQPNDTPPPEIQMLIGD